MILINVLYFAWLVRGGGKIVVGASSSGPPRSDNGTPVYGVRGVEPCGIALKMQSSRAGVSFFVSFYLAGVADSPFLSILQINVFFVRFQKGPVSYISDTRGSPHRPRTPLTTHPSRADVYRIESADIPANFSTNQGPTPRRACTYFCDVRMRRTSAYV